MTEIATNSQKTHHTVIEELQYPTKGDAIRPRKYFRFVTPFYSSKQINSSRGVKKKMKKSLLRKIAEFTQKNSRALITIALVFCHVFFLFPAKERVPLLKEFPAGFLCVFAYFCHLHRIT